MVFLAATLGETGHHMPQLRIAGLQLARDTGCRFVGAYEPQDYAVTDSGVCRDGKFVGLAVDELNEDDKTAARTDRWIEAVKRELS